MPSKQRRAPTSSAPPSEERAAASKAPASAGNAAAAAQLADRISVHVAGPDAGPEEIGEVVQAPDSETHSALCGCDACNVQLTPATRTGTGTMDGVGAGTRFGAARVDVALKDQAATRTAHGWDVTAKVDWFAKYQVADSMPGRESIAGPSDPKITHENYAQVATDLNPRSDVLGGQPARDQFWSHDRTVEHEKFHVAEMVQMAPELVAAEAARQSQWTAETAADALTMLDISPSVLTDAAKARLADGGEERAYGAQYGKYAADSMMIFTKGITDQYPSGKSDS